MDNGFCYFHNPDISEEQKKEAQSKGGKGNHRVQEPMSPLGLKQTKDVVSLLEETINALRAGQLDVKIANGVGYLAGQLVKAIEISELEKRVEGIEKVLKARGQ
jgi:hypothetical protein